MKFHPTPVKLPTPKPTRAGGPENDVKPPKQPAIFRYKAKGEK